MLRGYMSADYTACLAILDSNIPRFFSLQDRIDFLAFLDAPIGRYSVLENDYGSIIGCGGIALENDETGILNWGMIHVDYHRQGWGSILTLARLSQLSNMPSVKKVILHTSHETVGFYKKLGFQIVAFTSDFYRQGLHRYDMELSIDDNFQHRFTDIGASLLYQRYDHVMIQR